MPTHIYSQGDLVWLNFSPTKGHEEKGRRPALVVNISDAQRLGGLIWVLPITTTLNHRTLSVDINQPEVHGKVLVNQIRSIDPESKDRDVEYIGKCDSDVFNRVHDVMDQIFNQ